jgi:hypothetical protein
MLSAAEVERLARNLAKLRLDPVTWPRRRHNFA